MRVFRHTIAGTMLLVLLLRLGLAAVRSGSQLVLQCLYFGTVVTLLAAILVARYRALAFCFGFAVFGWGYFIFGYGPWANYNLYPSSGVDLNPNWPATDLIEMAVDYTGPEATPATSVRGGSMQVYWTQPHLVRRRVARGCAHLTVTTLFACLGGLIARALDRRRPGAMAAVGHQSYAEMPAGADAQALVNVP